MACKPTCKLCKRIRISQATNFDAATPALIIDLPAGSYNSGERYCIITAQNLPDSTTVTAPVYFTIGGGLVRYPLVKCNCSPVLAAGLRSRMRYSVVVETTATGGVFRMLGKPCCTPDNRLASINGTAPAATPAVTPTV